jgi:hypothetical protein
VAARIAERGLAALPTATHAPIAPSWTSQHRLAAPRRPQRQRQHLPDQQQQQQRARRPTRSSHHARDPISSCSAKSWLAAEAKTRTKRRATMRAMMRARMTMRMACEQRVNGETESKRMRKCSVSEVGGRILILVEAGEFCE